MATETVELARAKRRKMMLEESVFKVVPIVAVPMIISMLIDSFYNLADTYFVSSLGTAATAAVGINNSLMQLIRAVGLGFGMGAASYVSRLLGAKKYDDASKVISTALFTAMGAISVVAAGAFVLRGQLVTLLGATAGVKQHSMDYATFILLSAPFTVMNVVLSQALRAEGSTRQSMIGMVSGCIVNLALDPLFIFVFGWGVGGAAAATAISKVISAFVLLLPYLRKKTLLFIKPSLFTPKKEILLEIARMGVPTLFRSSLMGVANIISNNFAGLYGDSVLAAVSVSGRVMMMVASMVLGFGQGYQPIAGYCYGAKAYRRVKSAFWVTSLYGLIICVTFGSLLFALAPSIVGLFTTHDADIISIGAYMVRVQCIVLPLHVWVIIINGMFQAMGRAVQAAVLGLSRQALCFIPSVIVMNLAFGVNGLMLAQPVSDILSMLIALPLLIGIMRELNRMIAEQPAPVDEPAPETQPPLPPPEGQLEALGERLEETLEEALLPEAQPAEARAVNR